MFCCVWEMSGDWDRLLYWPKFFSWSLQHFFRILVGVAQPWVTQGPTLCKLIFTLALLAPTDWRPQEPCLYSFITSTCFRYSSAYLHRCISFHWRLGRGSIYNNHPILIFENVHLWTFSSRPLHPPHTHILQKMLKDNNQKCRRKLLEQQQNTKS